MKHQYFEQYKVMLGSVGKNVESVKFIGRRDMNMDANLRKIFNEADEYNFYPYFNDAKELWTIDFGFNLGKQLIINRNKIDWETLNTPKIKTVFYSHWSTEIDYGTRIRFKCHKPIQRKAKTLEAEFCSNWDFIDSFGVHTDGYKKFYDDPPGFWVNSSG